MGVISEQTFTKAVINIHNTTLAALLSCTTNHPAFTKERHSLHCDIIQIGMSMYSSFAFQISCYDLIGH